MKLLKIYILNLFMVLFVAGCSYDNGPDLPSVIEGEVNVQLKLITPPVSSPMSSATRAVDEAAIQNMTVVVFEQQGGQYVYSYDAFAYALSSGGITTTMEVRLPTNTTSQKLYLIANYPAVSNIVGPGLTEDVFRSSVNLPFTAAGIDNSIPMFAVIDLPGGLTSPGNLTARMLRSLARVDVVNSASDFELTTVRFYRVNDRYSVIPLPGNESSVTMPTIPAGASQSITTTSRNILPLGEERVFYLPESSKIQTNAQLNTATCMVVGGRYDGGLETFYRLDFKPENAPEVFGQILRNSKYIFEILGVRGAGWPTPDLAANNESSTIEADIKVWDENTIYMDFDDASYFGVSTKELHIQFEENASNTIAVDTDVAAYDLTWTDAAGNKLPSSSTITLGGSMDDEQDMFTVSISADGKSITVSTNFANYTDQMIPRYMLIEADRLRINITVYKCYMVLEQRNLYVYGSTTEIGTLGNEIYPTQVNPRLPAAMVAKMKAQQNFGTGGVMDFPGFKIGGIVDHNPPTNMTDMFDVIYLTYSGNPTAATYTGMLSWLGESDNRVLIIQYDNPDNTNQGIMSYLGVSYTRSTSLAPYTFYDNIPDVIGDGFFGEVDTSVPLRVNDNIHGEISDQVAQQNNITPILRGGSGGVVFGIDFTRRIVFSGDIDIYNSANTTQNITVTNGPDIQNDADKFIANFWAWVTETVLGRSC